MTEHRCLKNDWCPLGAHHRGPCAGSPLVSRLRRERDEAFAAGAAAEREAWQAERERLRRALEEIAEFDHYATRVVVEEALAIGMRSFTLAAGGPVEPPPEPLSGAALIAQERQRQIDAEGWTTDHDDEHSLGDTDAYERGRRFERGRIANLIRAKLTDGAVLTPSNTHAARLRAQVLRGAYERLLLDIDRLDQRSG